MVNALQNGWTVIEDCLGACRFNLVDPQSVLEAYNAVTGLNRSLGDMLKVGRRIVNTLRLFNLKNGLLPEVEEPSARYGSAPVDGPVKGIGILKDWQHIRKAYYRNMGWDPDTGIPTPETLKELGIG